MIKHSIIPLIKQWEEFTESKNSSNLHEFAEWLLDQEEIAPSAKVKNMEPVTSNEEYLAANYLSRLNKYVKAYVKPLLHDNQLNNSDEFAILSLISRMDRPTKREVCIANVMELSTGIDMIRRLLKANYLKEEKHENDARAKRLSLTKEGHAILVAVYKRLAGLQQRVLADLTRDEKIEFLRVLGYLENYHGRLYANLGV